MLKPGAAAIGTAPAEGGLAWPADAPQTPAAGASVELVTAQEVTRQLDLVQQELDALKGELNLVRRRDETLNYYMHRLDEELRLAARLQQDFLPRFLPRLGDVRFHTLFRPAGYVSGDLYDVMRLDEHRIGFYIADAVGHGMPAALLTMFVKHALVTKEIVGNEYRLLLPSESLARLNAALIEQDLSQAAFATALYGIIDVRTLEVTVSRAGHPAPILLRNGSCETLECDGPLLGIFADETFADARATLRAGDRLVLYTDGIEMAFCDGLCPESHQWRDQLCARADLSVEHLLTELAERLDRESGSLEPKDDLTVLVLEVLEVHRSSLAM